MAVLHRLVRDVDEWLRIADFGDIEVPTLAVRRELSALESAGVIERRSDIRPHGFRLPADAPLTPHLMQLLHLTAGVEVALADRLARIDGIEAAAIFGSWATGTVTPASDIDVIVLLDDDASRAAVGAVHDAATEVQRIIGRDVDPMIYTTREMRDKLAGGSGFLRTVIDGALVDLVGDVRSLAGRAGVDA